MFPNDMKEKLDERLLSWFWVILLVSSILFFKGLLSDLDVQTARIAQEREQLDQDMTEQRQKSEDMYQEFFAELNRSIGNAVGALSQGQTSAGSSNSLLNY